MTVLSLGARNLLALDPAIRRLVGRSRNWDTWIADETPVGIAVEGNSASLIVLREGPPWAAANEHNTMIFPTLLVDIWSDPTRDQTVEGRPVSVFDAKNKIERIHGLVKQHFHRPDPATPDGGLVFWGTEAQITSKTGVPILNSAFAKGPDFNPVRDSEGTWMGTYTYNVTTV